MIIYKFGGASVKNAEAIKNIANIIQASNNEKLVVVVSAMGKMTNAFEWLVNAYCYNKELVKNCLNEIVDFHNEIIWELFPDRSHKIYVEINEFFEQIEDILEKESYENHYNLAYDQLVCYGELISTTIVSNYLSEVEINNTWIDAREIVKANDHYREAKINWEETNAAINNTFSFVKNIAITQGFIGSNNKGYSVTLGREGSDFTAAILGYCLEAKSVTIWKDVPGVLNADPKFYPEAKKLDEISYHEAIELSFYGASVIHPKTIKPLQNKQIPLYVKSFVNPTEQGTIIQQSGENDSILPSLIFMKNQILISISPRDFSFIVEENLSLIFKELSLCRIRVNLMQNSALSFSVCVNYDEQKIPKFLEMIKENFKVLYNKNVELITIRHYDNETIEKATGEKKVLVQQKSRNTVRYVVENN